MRHEFGHVIMYKLQGNNIKIPYGVEGVNGHSWSNENTGLLAWIEGWANAIQMIMDAADYVEHLTNNQINDPEFGGEYIYILLITKIVKKRILTTVFVQSTT